MSKNIYIVTSFAHGYERDQLMMMQTSSCAEKKLIRLAIFTIWLIVGIFAGRGIAKILPLWWDEDVSRWSSYADFAVSFIAAWITILVLSRPLIRNVQYVWTPSSESPLEWALIVTLFATTLLFASMTVILHVLGDVCMYGLQSDTFDHLVRASFGFHPTYEQPFPPVYLASLAFVRSAFWITLMECILFVITLYIAFLIYGLSLAENPVKEN